MITAQAKSSANSRAVRTTGASCWHTLTLLLIAVATSGCPSTPHEGAGNGPGSKGGSAASHVDAGTDAPPVAPTPSADAGTDAPPVAPTPSADAGPDSETTDPEPPIAEPVTEADYYVRNDRSAELSIVATSIVGDARVELLEDTIPPNSEVHIFHALEGSGGHAMPSNFFGTFRVLLGDEAIYEGVRNEDWKADGQKLVLEVHEVVELSCEQAADCEIKNVGNCCGYYPRCVSVGSPTPPVECDEGVSSVCGWPVISHCECVENTCRSMQGDSEI